MDNSVRRTEISPANPNMPSEKEGNKIGEQDQKISEATGNQARGDVSNPNNPLQPACDQSKNKAAKTAENLAAVAKAAAKAAPAPPKMPERPKASSKKVLKKRFKSKPKTEGKQLDGLLKEAAMEKFLTKAKIPKEDLAKLKENASGQIEVDSDHLTQVLIANEEFQFDLALTSNKQDGFDIAKLDNEWRNNGGAEGEHLRPNIVSMHIDKGELQSDFLKRCSPMVENLSFEGNEEVNDSKMEELFGDESIELKRLSSVNLNKTTQVTGKGVRSMERLVQSGSLKEISAKEAAHGESIDEVLRDFANTYAHFSCTLSDGSVIAAIERPHSEEMEELDDENHTLKTAHTATLNRSAEAGNAIAEDSEDEEEGETRIESEPTTLGRNEAARGEEALLKSSKADADHAREVADDQKREEQIRGK